MTPPYFESITPVVLCQKLYEYLLKEGKGLKRKRLIYTYFSEFRRHFY